MMQYIYHHLDACLVHELRPSDFAGARLVYSPDAELGGDIYSTKATGGFWLHIESQDGERRWPIAWSCKRAGHTSGATADSETWSMIGACENGLKKEVIPLLHQLEVTLQRLVLLVCREDNTQTIAAVRRGYSPALRHLKRHVNLGIGFTSEVFYPDRSDPEAPQYWSSLVYCESKAQLGDWMTKELGPKDFQNAFEKAGYRIGPKAGCLARALVGGMNYAPYCQPIKEKAKAHLKVQGDPLLKQPYKPSLPGLPEDPTHCRRQTCEHHPLDSSWTSGGLPHLVLGCPTGMCNQARSEQRLDPERLGASNKSLRHV